MKRPGIFVVLEGPEGAGKTTLATRLAARLQVLGVAFVQVREPGGTPAAEALRHELLDRADRVWTPEAELLYIATARADLVAKVIRPALETGQLVLSDRYDLSTHAYQVAGRGLPEIHVRWVNEAATAGLTPDLTCVLDLPPEVGLARQVSAGKKQDRLDRESAAFHERVAARYRAAQGSGIVHVDATLPAEQVEQLVWDAVVAVRPEFFDK